MPKTKKIVRHVSAITPQSCYFVEAKEGRCSGQPTADDYCFGCHQWICEGHARNLALPAGSHDPYDHLEEVE